MSWCSRQGEQNGIQHGGVLSEDFLAGKTLVRRDGVAEMDIAKEVFALEEGGIVEGLLTEHGVPGRDVERGHFCPQTVFECIVGRLFNYGFHF